MKDLKGKKPELPNRRKIKNDYNLTQISYVCPLNVTSIIIQDTLIDGHIYNLLCGTGRIIY